MWMILLLVSHIFISRYCKYSDLLCMSMSLQCLIKKKQPKGISLHRRYITNSLCSLSFCSEINPSLILPIFSRSMGRPTGESENCLKYDSHIKMGLSSICLWRRVRAVKEVEISVTFIYRILLLKN